MALNRSQMIKLLGHSLILLGLGLLVVAGLGKWTPLGNLKRYELRDWEAFDVETVSRWRSMSDLQTEADQHLPEDPSEEEVMVALQDVIARRFSDGEGVHCLFSNWILWGLGQIHPAFLHVWSSDLLVSKGQSMHCDQASYMLMMLASERGILTRHVGLDGHVVMEAWYDGYWHLFDPDMEVIPVNGDGVVLSVDELAQDEDQLRKYYSRYPEMLEIVRSRKNNTFVSLPSGSRFDWKGNVLARLERVMEVLKFAVPAVMLAIGALLIRRRNPAA